MVGLDLSPQMVAVGQTLLREVPGIPPWVESICADPRCQLRQADIGATGLAAACAEVVCLTLVAYELV